MEFTKEQETAIATRDRTLLVSAAAGSGKTATLTERIISSILAKENRLSVSDMLIVTFTVAAVAELRERIGAALRAEIEKNGEDPALLSELYLLPSARICTIDAFCNETVRNNAQKLGLDPTYRVADEVEDTLLCAAVMERLIASAYEGEIPETVTPEDFADFASCMTGVRNDKSLGEKLLVLYSKTANYAKGVAELRPLIELYNPANFTTPCDTVFGQFITQHGKDMIKTAADALSYRLRTLPRGTANQIKYYDYIEEIIDMLKEACLAETDEALWSNINNINFSPKPSESKQDKTPEGIACESIRKKIWEKIQDFKDDYLFLTPEEWKQMFAKSYKMLSILFSFLEKYDQILMEEKRRRNLLSFSDIEQLCHACLYENGERTDYAKSLADRFCAVYIDEYQDVNRLQNDIFAAVSKPDNRFMVGDIKQSIYRFRGAEPDVFAGMKKRFPDLKSASGKEPAGIFLSANFRSDRPVIDFINAVFDPLFAQIGDTIGYTEADRLTFAKQFPNGEPTCPVPEVHLFTVEKDSKIPAEKRQRAEAHAMGETIADLLKNGKKDDGTPFTPDDIVVLFRDMKSKAPIYADEFRKCGLPVSISGEKTFFLSPEILLALAFLNTIDNPQRDIYLAGTLLSPLFGFTADELLSLSKSADAPTLYGKMLSENAVPKEKVANFLAALKRFRIYAEDCPVSTLLAKIFGETGMLALAAENGGKDNLMLLYEHARTFESGSFSGLHAFIAYLNNMIASSNTFKVQEGNGAEGRIRIMSIHASKGLQFPACFLADAASEIRDKDEKTLVYADGFGLSCRLRDSTGLALLESPVYNCLTRYNFEKMFDEQCRILYVALTRAQERLYVFGTVDMTKEKYDDKAELDRVLMSPYTARQLPSFIQIISATSRIHKTVHTVLSAEEKESHPDGKFEKKAESAAVQPDEKKARELAAALSFRPDAAETTDLPEKLSVSRLSPSLLDDPGDDGTAILPSLDSDGNDPGAEDDRPTVPAFISGKRSDESALRGIATHRFLQFCNFEKLAASGVNTELERLRTENFLSEKDAELVRTEEIEKFLTSPLYRRMTSAKKLYREFRFNLCMPAALFTTEEEKKAAYAGRTILVQGVIDCLIENPDGSLSLIDYKTDRLSARELADRALAEEKLRAAHALQLHYYEKAVLEMFGKAPETVEVYSLALGDTVSVKLR